MRYLLLSLIFFANYSLALSTLSYQVEILVLTHLSKESLNSELWPHIQPFKASIATQEATNKQITPAVKDVGFKHFKLSALDRSIRRRSGYQLIYHHAWLISTLTPSIKSITLNLNNDLNNIRNSNQDTYPVLITGHINLRLQKYFTMYLSLIHI